MTGGVVAVLGRCGSNFGAGMTGGFAYVLDEAGDFAKQLNHELVDMQPIDGEAFNDHQIFLRDLIKEYTRETGSVWGEELVRDFTTWVGKFWLVKPKAANVANLLINLTARGE
jgi:glutamate synthase (NADPH/NADH) large chain